MPMQRIRGGGSPRSEVDMGEMLQHGDRLPSITLNLTNGETLQPPEDMPSRYVALLFYRGHW